MDLEEFKVGWKKQEAVRYSDEELESIYQIREARTLSNLLTGFTWDLVVALALSALFIIILQVSDLKTSNFWSICMGILALQHLVFYQYQHRLIKRYSHCDDNVRKSIESSLNRLKKLLWVYRLSPALLIIVLYAVYINQFGSMGSIWQSLSVGIILAAIGALIANQLSAVLVRKHYVKLIELQKNLSTQLKSTL